MYKIAICDDDKRMLETVHTLIEEYGHKNEVLLKDYTYTNPNRLLSELEDHQLFDVYLVDVEMPKMNGLDVIKAIKKIHKDALVIVLTSYGHYAIEAIELEIFRYLVKGRLNESFEAYLRAALQRIDLQEKESYLIDTPRRKQRIFCKDIIYCCKDKDSKTIILMTKAGSIRERKNLQNVWKDLKQLSEDFVFVERSCFVNKLYVTGIDKNNIYLENNTVLRIGGTYIEDLKKELALFWRNRI